MKRSNVSFRIIVSAAGLIFFFLNYITALLFLKINLPLYYAVSGLLFIIVLNFLELKAAGLYGRSKAVENQKKNDLAGFLSAVGGAPLKVIIHYILVSIFFLAVLGFMVIRGSGHKPQEVIILTVFDFSLCFATAAFIYVILDTLNLKFLQKLGITDYPPSLKENRQQKKIFIIPLFLAIMTLLITLFGILLITSTVDETAAASGASMVSVYLKRFLPVLVSYIAVVVSLMFIWNYNTGYLYSMVINQLDKIISKEKDLRGRITIASVDELATIAGGVNGFCHMLFTSITQIQGVFENLHAVQAELLGSIEESRNQVADIAEHIAGSIAITGDVGEAVDKSLTAARILIQTLEDIHGKIRTGTESITESSGRVERMIVAINQTAKSTVEAKTSIENLVEKSEKGVSNMANTMESVKSIAKLSKYLVEINNLIANVAAKTNMLSMNASIEAAHAGSAGRGFSVVADEIRNLAETTAKNTTLSRESLKSIQTEIENALSLSETTSSDFKDMHNTVREVDAIAERIAVAMSEQQEANQELLSYLTETIHITQDMERSIHNLRELGSELNMSFETLGGQTKRAADVSEIMKKGNASVKESMENLRKLSITTTGLKDRMSKLLEEFTI